MSNDIYYNKYNKYKNKYLKLKGGAALKEGIKAGVLAAVRKKMEKPDSLPPALTEESFRGARTSVSSKRTSKKIIVCKNAVKIDKYGMIETFGAKTNTFIYFLTDSGGGQSSFLIKEPYERVRSNGIDRQIICETNNSIYVIPKEKFYNGNSLLTKYLIDN